MFESFFYKVAGLILEFLLNKVAGLQTCDFIKKILKHRYAIVTKTQVPLLPFYRRLFEKITMS